MARFGLICPEMSGHLNPMCALGRELTLRGHELILLGLRDGEAQARSAGLEFSPIGEQEFGLGEWKKATQEMGRLKGLKAFRFTIGCYKKSAEVFLRDLPDVVQKTGVEGMIIDQTSIPGATVAERFGLPFVSVACALMMNAEPAVPPMVSPWNYRDTWLCRMRNRVGQFLFRQAVSSVPKFINRQRMLWNMPPYRSENDSFSQLAQIAQVPKEFDFPRQHLPECFHYTGPLHTTESRAEVPFPYEQLTGQPLIYASLGTLQNRLGHLFQIIVDACRGLDVQLVLSIGGGNAGELKNVPTSAIVVQFAPQLELLNRASLTITHAGMNTTMESLSQAVPMVCLPVTNDQPAVAARVAWTKTGEVLPLKKLQPDRLKAAIQTVMQDETYHQNAKVMQTAIQQAGGLSRAADIVETALLTKQPVLEKPKASVGRQPEDSVN